MTDLEKEQFSIELDLKYKEKNIFLSYGFLAILGVFGVHRFYLGHYISGFIMLFLTLSWFLSWISAIWVFVDIYFVYKYVEEHNTLMKLLKLKELNSINKKEENKMNEEIKMENY